MLGTLTGPRPRQAALTAGSRVLQQRYADAERLTNNVVYADPKTLNAMHTMADTDITAPEVDAPEPIAETPAEETTEATPLEPSQPDYKAIADAEKARADAAEAARVAAEKAAAAAAFKARQAQREDSTQTVPESDAVVIDPTQPLTYADLDRALDAREQARERQAQEAKALELARKNTTTEDQAQAAFQKWRSSVVPSGDIEADMMFVIRGLHSAVIAGHTAEVQRAQAADATATTDTAETHRDPAPGAEVKIAPQDASAIKAAGMSWDGAKRLYKKSLEKSGKGKFLYYDPKTKKRWVA